MNRREMLAAGLRLLPVALTTSYSPTVMGKQNVFRSPDDVHRVKEVRLDGEVVQYCIKAVLDLGRPDGFGMVSFYAEDVNGDLIVRDDHLQIGHAKGMVEVELYD